MERYEKEKQLINKLLNVLVEMSNHCNCMESEMPNKSKCIGCGFKIDFGVTNCGCLLVDILENYELIDLIRDTCRYQNIKCEDKLNQAMEIFEGESCE